MSPRTIYYRANLSDQAGMASLFPPEPLLPVPKLDKRTLPPDIRQEIVDSHAQYPAFHPHKIATICFVKFNRKLYHLHVPRTPRPKAEMPFRSVGRHQHWSVDIRYLDMHKLGGGMIYCISILENFSRAILASAISRKQDTEAFFVVFYDAVRQFGVPEVLVSDNGSIFTSHETKWTCEQLSMEKTVRAGESHLYAPFLAVERT